MRYFLELSYDGTNYHGWQIQPNAISVQEKINESLSLLLQSEIMIMGAGRTDAGVHASQMYAHFDTDKKFQADKLLHRLNAILPEDIAINKLFLVADDVHARFDATSRSYEYKIYLGRNPFLTHSTWQLYTKKLDVNLMNSTAKILLNYQDFKCFSKSKTDVNTYNCTITNAIWKQEGNLLVFHITADRFLRNMVRAIVGTLVNIGLHKSSIDDFKNIIESRDRSQAGFSVPAKGLFLTHIKYPISILENE